MVRPHEATGQATPAAEKRRRGRPRKSTGGLTKTISCRLSADAFETWQARVKASGLGPGAYLRRAIVEDRTTIVAQRAPGDVGRLAGQLGKLGNNLNQLARSVNRAHLEGSVRDETYQEVRRELRALRAEFRAVLALEAEPQVRARNGTLGLGIAEEDT